MFPCFFCPRRAGPKSASPLAQPQSGGKGCRSLGARHGRLIGSRLGKNEVVFSRKSVHHSLASGRSGKLTYSFSHTGGPLALKLYAEQLQFVSSGAARILSRKPFHPAPYRFSNDASSNGTLANKELSDELAKANVCVSMRWGWR